MTSLSAPFSEKSMLPGMPHRISEVRPQPVAFELFGLVHLACATAIPAEGQKADVAGAIGLMGHETRGRMAN